MAVINRLKSPAASSDDTLGVECLRRATEWKIRGGGCAPICGCEPRCCNHVPPGQSFL